MKSKILSILATATVFMFLQMAFFGIGVAYAALRGEKELIGSGVVVALIFNALWGIVDLWEKIYAGKDAPDAK